MSGIQVQVDSNEKFSIDETKKKIEKDKSSGRLPISSAPLRRAGSGSEADSDNDDDGENVKEEKEDGINSDMDGQDSKEGDGSMTSDQAVVVLDPGEMSSYGDDERTEQESDYPPSRKEKNKLPKLDFSLSHIASSSTPRTPRKELNSKQPPNDELESKNTENTTRKKSHSRKGNNGGTQRRRGGRVSPK